MEIIKTMNRTYLGEFEEIVLLCVATMTEQAYGVSVLHEIAEQTGRSVRLNQIHSALQRLEEKGMIKSDMSDPTSERGGRRKRIYSVTAFGQRTLQQIQEVRDNFWSRLTNPLKLSTSL